MVKNGRLVLLNERSALHGCLLDSVTVERYLMKLVLSAVTALVLGTAVMTTSASAQPHCWWHGVNHCYVHHHGYWYHGHYYH
jgi:hypothetical protein